MRLIRLRLTNYRGIDESEVEFGPHGLTIVEGPNETGKTCLGEAVGLLFDFLDSSKHRMVKAIKPVSFDVGSEIELEAASGPYVFKYFKRFNKKTETTLTVTHPRPENHTGSEAHERAKAILHETIDVDLWKALCIQQGEAIEQADLSKQSSLSAALDIAAGGQRSDLPEESLFDRVASEHARYFTEKGSEKKDFKSTLKAREHAESKVASLTEQIHDLEKDIVRAADLETELEQAKEQEMRLNSEVSEYKQTLDEIDKLEATLETAKLKLDSARKTEQAAKQDLTQRAAQIEAISETRKEHAKLEEANATAITSAKRADDKLKAAQSKEAKATSKRKHAESLATLRRADVDYFNNKLHLEQLRERKSRIDNGRKEAALAKELLASNRVDEPALIAIQKAEVALVEAQAQLKIGAPDILLRGLAEAEVLIDDHQTTILQNEEINLVVPNQTQVTIPGLIQMKVTAGSSADDLTRNVEEAKQKLEAVCKSAGVIDAEEARLSNKARQEAQQTVSRQKDIEKNDLRDLSYEELESKVIGLESSVPTYAVDRIAKPELPNNLESAKQELLSAEGELSKADQAWQEARTDLDADREVRDQMNERHLQINIKLDLKSEVLKHAEKELALSQENSPDEILDAEHTKALGLVSSAEEHVQSSETCLSEQEPDRVKALAETATGSLKTVMNRREALQEERTEVRTRLKVFGEEGLHEKLNIAQSALSHIAQESEAMLRRAQAARMLYTIMRDERDTARRAYIAPLKDKIERLGHLVFNGSFEVDLTDDLSVASRAMDGSNVPFESLSGGTREQISLISRLACAMIASKDGGASIILDDALGYTDPARLKLMGAVLAKAGKECQIIILTCVPDRYSNVGEAKVVRLG